MQKIHKRQIMKGTTNLERDLQAAKQATLTLALLDNAKRSAVVRDMAKFLRNGKDEIIKANAIDLRNAKDLSESMQKRLELNEKKIEAMADSLEVIAGLSDPLQRISSGWEMPSGIKIQKVSVPLGVIGVIYESRPNVTSDVSALCLKSGNVCVLKGGKEALHSNRAILQCLHNALKAHKLPLECIIMLESHDDVAEFLTQEKYIDLLIPRGGENLIRFVQEHSKIPIIKHDKGVCHLYVHSDFNEHYAISVALDSKTSYPAACNAIETLLLDSAIAQDFLPILAKALKQKGTTLLGDEQIARIIAIDGKPDYTKEYGQNILNLKIVGGLDEAIAHINAFGSQHSDSIITNDIGVAEVFLNQVQSACVYVNASTRFSDGGEFGFGAEVGISTSKLHARGPMGIESLTTYKYKITANGAVRG